MRVNRLEIFAITALIVNYVASNDVENRATTETANEIPTSVTSDKDVAAKSVTVATRMDNWMSRMGPMQNDLVNIQAMIVKDEDLSGTNCARPAARKSNKRYLMCAGSILNRNHVLTSATCVHEATHIRHNIRAPLAVVIAPLKPSIQVIAVTEYQIHPLHQSNPFSKDHLKHNVAILKLACRIEMENYHKVDFPPTPMMQTCSEDNCVVAVYRKTGTTSNVMFQMLAPNMPYPSRRRKETSSSDYATHPARPKRKLAERPTFARKSASATTPRLDSSKVSLATTTGVPEVSKVSANETSLHDEVSKALHGLRVSGNATVKSFVVRSSIKYRSCGLTGAPIMLNHTQAAIVAVPCDSRQPSSRWSYSDLFENLAWIQSAMEKWGPIIESLAPGILTPTPAPAPPPSGNGTGCSTCIFNFFIEIGCKDKSQCGKNFTHGAHVNGHTSGAAGGVPGGSEIGPTRRKIGSDGRSGCSTGNSVGIEIGVGQGCDKTGSGGAGDSESRLVYAGKSARPIDPAAVKQPKHLSAVAPIDDRQQQQQQLRQRQPVASRSAKSTLADYIHDEKPVAYPGKDISRAPRMYETPVAESSARRESRMQNEIGLRNIEGDAGDWIAEGVDSGAEAKLAKSRRPNVRQTKIN